MNQPADPSTTSERQRNHEGLHRISNMPNIEPPTVNYPTITPTIVNDYNTSGLLSMAFPTLFPYGVGDVTNRDRHFPITECQAAKHYINYCVNLKTAHESVGVPYSPQPTASSADQDWYYPFASHDRFIHFIQNMNERHMAQGQRSYYLSSNPKFSELTEEDLERIIDENGQELSDLIGSMQSFNANINGSPQYLFKKRLLLEAMIDQLGMPTMWFTLSMADNHWHDLHKVLHRNEKGAEIPFPNFNSHEEEASWKRKVVRENLHIVDEYFMQRVRSLFDCFFKLHGLELEWHWLRVEYQGRGAPHIHGCLRMKHAPDLTEKAKLVLRGRQACRILKARGLLPDDFLSLPHFEKDIWVDRTVSEDTLNLTTIDDHDYEALLDIAKVGEEAHKVIVAFHDFFLTTNHPDPPIDATSASRDDSTFFNPSNASEAHPSSIDVLPIITNPVALNNLYTRGLNVQNRHKHQKYCDRNFGKRERAKILLQNNRLGVNDSHPDDIEPDCRFDFAKQLSNDTFAFVEESIDNSGFLKYRIRLQSKRNDGWLNSTFRSIAEVWNANMDWQLVLDKGMVTEYMTKYVTKSDFSTDAGLQRLMKSVYRQTVTEQGRSSQACLRRLMSKLLGERIMSKQEKAHLINSLPIVQASHQLVNVDLRNQSRALITSRQNQDDTGSNQVLDVAVPVVKLSIIDAYARRKEDKLWQHLEHKAYCETLEDTLNLVDFCKHFTVGKKCNLITLRTANNCVFNFFPSGSFYSDQPSYPKYCEYALMKYHPWEGTPENIWTSTENNLDVVQYWREFITERLRDSFDKIPYSLEKQLHLNSIREKSLMNGENNGENPRGPSDSHSSDLRFSRDVSFFSDDALLNIDDALIASNNEFLTEINSDEIDGESFVAWDSDYNWKENSISSYETIESAHQVLNQARNETLNYQRKVVMKDTLNEKQRLAHDMVVRACLSEALASSSDQSLPEIGRLQILIGAGGCGKSYVINSILTTLIQDYNWDETNFSVYATTGKAAAAICGSTVQNYSTGLSFISGKKLQDMSSSSKMAFQDRMSQKKLIIIDEFSMLNQADLHSIDKRLQVAKSCDLEFGGVVVLLCGDPAQLPAVNGRCLWSPHPKSDSNDSHGLNKYRMFDSVVLLEENNRADANDPEYTRFSDFLNRLRDGANTHDDWRYLINNCSQHSMPRERWSEFVDATHLYCTNKEVFARNIECLKNLGKPILRINAKHTGRGGNFSHSIAKGLEKLLYLSVDSKVLLTSNLWVSAGLVNGSSGTVVDICFKGDEKPPDLPHCIVVDFGSSYRGPPLFLPDDGSRKGWVPIFPETVEWSSTCNGDAQCSSRTMFPLRLCYAWTIWKAQGQTIRNKIIVSLGKTEKEHGLTYTAFSRVQRFSDIGIIGGISQDRLCNKIKDLKKTQVRIKEETRLRNLSRFTICTLRRLRN